MGLAAPRQESGYRCEVLDWGLTYDFDLIVLDSTCSSIYLYSKFKDFLNSEFQSAKAA